MADNYTEAIEAIRGKTDISPRVAVILGSGLGDVADAVESPVCIPFGEIPHWPVSTAIGHAGRLVIGTMSGVPIVVMQGRVHFYEGYTMQQITFPIRVFKRMGVRTLLATNASGGINVNFAPGELCAISDHINFMGTNPLIGPNDESMGVRFPDMTFAYDREYLDILSDAARENKITLHKGVYAAFSGPSYETPAEIRMARTMGADLVGMSTVPEIIVANHVGIRAAAVSCISNYAAGIKSERLAHEEVLAGMARAAGSLATIVKGFIAALGR